MAVGEEFDRVGVRAEDYRVDAGRNGSRHEDADRYDSKATYNVREPLPRAAGAPLPMGSPGKSQGSMRGDSSQSRTQIPPPGRALSVPAASDPDHSSGMQWFAGVMKQAVPFVQKLLPLIDGQIATAVANLLARPYTPPPAPRIDLQPIENSVSDLQLQQANFKDQLADQNTALKRVEDHLQMVREATDRNTLEQQELIEDLKTMSSRMNRVALLILILLVISVLVNLSLFLHIQRVLP
jgi:hypothetical protein